MPSSSANALSAAQETATKLKRAAARWNQMRDRAGSSRSFPTKKRRVFGFDLMSVPDCHFPLGEKVSRLQKVRNLNFSVNIVIYSAPRDLLATDFASLD